MSDMSLEEMEVAARNIASALERKDMNGALVELQEVMRRSFKAGAESKRRPKRLAEDVLALSSMDWCRFVNALSAGDGGGHVTSRTNSGYPMVALRPLGAEHVFVENEGDLGTELLAGLGGAVEQMGKTVRAVYPEGAFPGLFFVQVLRDLVPPGSAKAP